ncbi:MAG: hypothetical protein WB676_09680 [Bryobacteraceae bacterium]
MKYPTFYRTIQIDGLSFFYREAGPSDFALDTAADEIAVLVQNFAGDAAPALVRRARS